MVDIDNDEIVIPRTGKYLVTYNVHLTTATTPTSAIVELWVNNNRLLDAMYTRGGNSVNIYTMNDDYVLQLSKDDLLATRATILGGSSPVFEIFMAVSFMHD
jgi:hypothetical protein